ncbi:MAG: permease [Nitrospinae bacterium]|nr:permease [Nitrospinota bacterium]
MKDTNLIVITLLFGLAAAAMVAYGYVKGGGQGALGIKLAATNLGRVLPLLIFAFIIAGMVQALVPQDLIAHWVGEGSGWRGIMVGTVAGAMTPAGPFVSFPIAAALLKAGACVGPLVAFLTAWMLLSVSRIPIELGILGWKLTLIRVACCFFVPPVAGWLAWRVFGCYE